MSLLHIHKPGTYLRKVERVGNTEKQTQYWTKSAQVRNQNRTACCCRNKVTNKFTQKKKKKSQVAQANSTMLDCRFTTNSNHVVVSQNRSEQLHNQGRNENAVTSHPVCQAILQAPPSHHGSQHHLWATAHSSLARNGYVFQLKSPCAYVKMRASM